MPERLASPPNQGHAWRAQQSSARRPSTRGATAPQGAQLVNFVSCCFCPQCLNAATARNGPTGYRASWPWTNAVFPTSPREDQGRLMNVLREKTSGELFASDDLNLDKPLRAVSSPRVQDLFAPESSGNQLTSPGRSSHPPSRARGGQKWQLTWNSPDVRTRVRKAEIWIHSCAKRICPKRLASTPTNLTPGERSDLWRVGPSTAAWRSYARSAAGEFG